MIPNATPFNLEHQQLWLLPEKALYWKKRNTLLVADLHIGKAGHFRKNGIPVPDQVNRSNLENLTGLLEQTGAERLVILGDLFHSKMNNEWQALVKWRKKYHRLDISLVIGNHDILNEEHYRSINIRLFKRMLLAPFLLVHDIDELKREEVENYILSGHIHPAVQLKGAGRQSMKLPCFYFGKRQGILPAFGAFTGTHIIKPTDKDHIFMIVNSGVVPARQTKK